jgi:hypothetical protein
MGLVAFCLNLIYMYVYVRMYMYVYEHVRNFNIFLGRKNNELISFI